nr:hypothetical protein [Tanacetum cinerariifolium]
IQHTPPQSPQPQPQPQPQALQQAADFPMSLLQESLDACATLTKRVKHLEYDKVAQALEITKLKRRIIDDLDKDDTVALMDDKKEEKDKVVEDDQVYRRQAESQTKMYKIDLDHASKVLSMQKDEPAEVQEVVDIVTTAKLITEVVTAASETVSVASTIIFAAEPQVPAATITAAPTKEQMEEEESRALQSINETPTQKEAKRRKLNKEVEDLKRHLEIVPDEDDDVYTEATPLARKNFDREDLEALWNLVKERFFTSKPKNFSDDFLLNTFGEMFKKPDGQAQVWKNQRSIHGQGKVMSWKLLESCGVHVITFSNIQLILLVERRYPLSTFTLDQMLNAVRLQVEEESEMALELLRFTRQQHQEGQLE